MVSKHNSKRIRCNIKNLRNIINKKHDDVINVDFARVN